MIKLITILGARPQFIKAAMLSKEIAKDKQFQEVVVHTGQHFENNMSTIFFDEMQIPQPNYFLDINSMSHGAMTGRMIEEIEKILIKESPACVIVYGDTNSTLAGALAAVKLQIPIAHIEAGVRSGYYLPEEVNRILTDNISEFLFCPSERAKHCLIDTGVSADKIINCGDIMYDSALYYSTLYCESSLDELGLSTNEYILVTLHREENTNSDEVLESVMKEFFSLSHTNRLVFLLHPRTKKRLIEINLFEKLSTCFLVLEPQSYISTLGLVNNARLVITDSGGLQKEAFYLKTPTIVIKRKTEWPELLETGLVKLLPAARINQLGMLISTGFHENKFNAPYGSGNSAAIIAKHLLEKLLTRDETGISKE